MPAPHTSGGSIGASRPGAPAPRRAVERGPRVARPAGRAAEPPRPAARSRPACGRRDEIEDRAAPGPRGGDVDDRVAVDDAHAARRHRQSGTGRASCDSPWMGRRAGSRSRSGSTACGRGRRASRQAEPAPEDLVAGLLVEDLPLRAAFRRRAARSSPRILRTSASIDSSTRVSSERARRISFRTSSGVLSGGHALLREHLFRQARREVKQPLAAPLHHRTNPRSRASFSRVFAKSCR